ncbi:NAD(P)/FAD-dependent oxidoreductase [Actinoplanes sp. NPDC051851]|uniref:FAD-dependent oxidoreductase n=1 Tax=Actinoplanes sp. NPDC051851 TaxID=3154753 RepID=UPI003420B4B7
MTSSVPRTARISVIGGGPGGLTCARILQRHGLTVTVYDRDAGPDSRNQGGSLDLHADDGQIALREAGLLDEFFALSRPEGQESRQIGPDGVIRDRQTPEPGDRFKPEIDRGVLRTMLLDSLVPGTVRWGAALTQVTGPDDGPRTLHFADGSTTETDLVIGADGAFSKVRAAVSPVVPRYCGISFLESWFDDVDTRHPEIAELVGQGLAMAADGRRALVGQRNGGGHLRVYVVQRVPVDWLAAAGLTGTEAVREHLLREYAGWSPLMRRLITDNDGPYIDRPIFVLPTPYAWPHVPTVTLLGDAAHVLPPVGVGVNLAMLDASDLALALARSATIDEALRAYHDIMIPRATGIAEFAEHSAGFLLDDDPAPIPS